jgi:glycosyltransferase involved in cell wall biosynthesis
VKILVLSTIAGCEWAGTEEVWFQFAELALSVGHEVMLAADHQVANGVRVRAMLEKGLLVTSRRPFRPQRLYNFKEGFFPDHSAALNWKPHVCLINAGSPLDLEFCPYLNSFLGKLNCKKVFFCHFNSDRLHFSDRLRTAKIIKSMDGLVFVSESNKEMLENQLALELKDAYVFQNTSRLNLSAPLEYPRLDSPKFANVARLEAFWKGQDLLIQVLAHPIWIQRQWTVDFFGSGKDHEYIQELIKLRKLASKARLCGYESSLERIWASRHMLLLPSRGEGTPLVILEAMMCGRPVVATDVGGNSEIVEDGVTGYLAEAPTVRAFAKAMERAWENRATWKNMGALAHEKSKGLLKKNPELELMNFIETICLK